MQVKLHVWSLVQMHNTLQLAQWTVTYGYLVSLVTKKPTRMMTLHKTREESVRKLRQQIANVHLWFTPWNLNFCCILQFWKQWGVVIVVSWVLRGNPNDHNSRTLEFSYSVSRSNMFSSLSPCTFKICTRNFLFLLATIEFEANFFKLENLNRFG